MTRFYELEKVTGEREFFRTFKSLLNDYGVTDKREYNRLYQQLRRSGIAEAKFGKIKRHDFKDA